MAFFIFVTHESIKIMLLGIFDVFHITEFNGKITNWGEVLVTMIGTGGVSGAVAYYAAKRQINNQKDYELDLQNDRDTIDLQYLVYLLETSIIVLNQNLTNIKKDKVVEGIKKDKVDYSFHWYHPQLTQELAKFGTDRIFELLLKRSSQKSDIQKFTNFISAIGTHKELIEILNSDLKNFSEINKELTKGINDLYQDFIKRLDYDKVDQNENSIFRRGTPFEEKLQEVLKLRRNEEIKNPLYCIYILMEYVYHHVLNTPIDQSNELLIHEYVIPIYNLFTKYKYNQENINTKLGIRYDEIEKVTEKITDFYNLLE